MPDMTPTVESSRFNSFCASSPTDFSTSKPCSSRMVCKGWRKSWLAAARKRDLAIFACSARLPGGVKRFGSALLFR